MATTPRYCSSRLPSRATGSSLNRPEHKAQAHRPANPPARTDTRGPSGSTIVSGYRRARRLGVGPWWVGLAPACAFVFAFASAFACSFRGLFACVLSWVEIL